MLVPFSLTSEFVGMAGCAPTASHEPLDGEGMSDDSSVGDVAPRHCLSRECAMVDAPRQPPVVVESTQTHTPPDPHVEALTSAQAHAEKLRQRPQNQPPPTPARSAQHVAPHAHSLADGARGHACNTLGVSLA